jgi:hypothetical protein
VNPRGWLIVRYRGYVAIVFCLVLALVLEALYTTWSVHNEFHQSCIALEAQAHSTFYPLALRKDFEALASQRGC